MTNTNSTQVNEMPAAGKNKVPPEFISSVDGDFVPKDSVPENTERMTGGTQKGEPETGPNAKLEAGEMGVGELEGAKFRVEPLRRTGEDANTMRARLVCMCLPQLHFSDADHAYRSKPETRHPRSRSPHVDIRRHTSRKHEHVTNGSVRSLP